MKDLAPLLLVLALGALTVVGWSQVLRGDGASAIAHTPNSAPDGEATAVDEALSAMAHLRGMATIRCSVKEQASWPFERAVWADGLLRAIVPGSRGSRVLFPVDAVDRPPLGLLRWADASADDPGGCEVVATARSRVSGLVEVEGRPDSSQIRLRVCGTTVHADENSSFTVRAWSGQRCLAYVSQPDLTQGFVPFEVEPLDASRLVVLATPQDEPGTEIQRRYVIPKRTGAHDALAHPGLSEQAKKMLQGWAELDRERVILREQTSHSADGILPEAPPEEEPFP